MSTKNEPVFGYGRPTEVQKRAGRSSFPLGLMIAATALGAVTIALIWFVAVPIGTGVCPAVYPPPPQCSAINREGTALVVSFVVVAIYIITALVAVFARTLRMILIVGVVLLAVAPIVSYAAVAWSPRFPLTP